MFSNGSPFRTGQYMSPSVSADFWNPLLDVIVQEDGIIRIRQVGTIEAPARRISDRLLHWARVTPSAVFLADRVPNESGWRKTTYRQMLDAVERVAAHLLEFDLSSERPVVILSGADLEHAILALACMHVGIPYAALSEGHSLAGRDFAKLNAIIDTLNPGLIFASDGKRFGPALQVAAADDVLVYVTKNASGGGYQLFSELLMETSRSKVDAARQVVAPQTIAKFLFTSGSTGTPKAVINTNAMICANQAMIADCYRFMKDEPPVVLEWAPWSHTAAGNKTFFMVLFNGGTYYIDDGSPTPSGIAKTARNLREIAPTWYFNVPRGYEELLHVLGADKKTCDLFFSRVRMLMHAGASLPRHVFEEIQRLAVSSTGRQILMVSGLGATESSPFTFMCTWQTDTSGNIGVPAKGIDVKLVPVGDKLEARLRGQNVTPGYWKDADQTAAAFDDEGYYSLGDALQFIDPENPAKGLRFDGRTAENFKLRTGTWVNVAAVRQALIDQFGGLISDAAITGLDEDYLGALVFPDLRECRRIAGADEGADYADVLSDPTVIEQFRARLALHDQEGTGSSNTVKTILIMANPLSAADGEITEKGGISQQAVLVNRRDDVERIYDQRDHPLKIRMSQ